MTAGFDTGFFIRLLEGEPRAVSVWSRLAGPGEKGVVSCLTLFELERLYLKGALRAWPQLGPALAEVCAVAWLNGDILSRAARMSHGLGIPAIDSMILASMLHEGAETIYTTDRHLTCYKNKRISIELL